MTSRICAIVLGTCAAAVAAAPGQPPGALNARDYDDGASPTAGIQEAIDRLPPAGGWVYVPEGLYVLQRPVALRPGTRLSGAGAGKTVLRKSDGFRIPLAEDAPKGQDFVVLSDPGPVRAGMALAVSDRKHNASLGCLFLVSRLDGARAYLENVRGGPGALRAGLAVADDACAMNLFMMILPARDSLVEDLELDGNRDAHRLDEAVRFGFESYGMLFAGIYPAGEMDVARCRIRRCPIGIHANTLLGPRVVECDIRDCWQGIHLGGGPYSLILRSRLSGHVGAISFCYGNSGVIIRDNDIHGNEYGIGGLGFVTDQSPSTADRACAIQGNRFWGNRGPGIVSGQGLMGPRSFLVCDNTLQGNGGASLRLGLHQAPADICLFNATHCVIMDNQCAAAPAFTGSVVEAAPAGSAALTVRGALPDGPGGWTAVLAGGTACETVAVTAVTAGRWTLAAPLEHPVEAGAAVTGDSPLTFGIFAPGAQADGNVIARNACAGNRLGGVVAAGSDLRAESNRGSVVRLDPEAPLMPQLFPAAGDVPIPNAGFEEDGGWTLATGQAECDGGAARGGRRSMKLIRPASAGTSGIRLAPPAPLKPDTWYRLSAWVRSGIHTDGWTPLPHLFLWDPRQNRQFGGQTRIEDTLEQPVGTLRAAEPLTWNWTQAQIFSGSATAAVVHAYLSPGRAAAGAGWVDDIRLEELTVAPPAAASIMPALREMPDPPGSAPGGTVTPLAAGERVLDRPLVLKPGETLLGCGPGTILKRPALVKCMLTADAGAGQDEVAVADASGLKEGMAVCVADRRTVGAGNGPLVIRTIAGNRVSLSGLDGGRGALAASCTVAEQACLVTLFPLVIAPDRARVSGLVLDGGLDPAAGDALAGYAAFDQPRAGALLVAGDGARVSWIAARRGWTGIGIVGRDVRVEYCTVSSNRAQGILVEKAGAVVVEGTRIHGNARHGIEVRDGDAVTVTANQVRDNGTGLFIRDTTARAEEARPVRLTGNVVEGNTGSGIVADRARGLEIQANLSFNNNQVGQADADPLRPAGSGIELTDCRDCRVTGNRCFDDRDQFGVTGSWGELARNAAQGADRITMKGQGYALSWAYAGKTAWLTDGARQERIRIVKVEKQDLILAEPLRSPFPEGARAIVPKQQAWGIHLAGASSRGLRIEYNQGAGNLSGPLTNAAPVEALVHE